MKKLVVTGLAVVSLFMLAPGAVADSCACGNGSYEVIRFAHDGHEDCYYRYWDGGNYVTHGPVHGC